MCQCGVRNYIRMSDTVRVIRLLVFTMDKHKCESCQIGISRSFWGPLMIIMISIFNNPSFTEPL